MTSKSSRVLSSTCVYLYPLAVAFPRARFPREAFRSCLHAAIRVEMRLAAFAGVYPPSHASFRVYLAGSRSLPPTPTRARPPLAASKGIPNDRAQPFTPASLLRLLSLSLPLFSPLLSSCSLSPVCARTAHVHRRAHAAGTRRRDTYASLRVSPCLSAPLRSSPFLSVPLCPSPRLSAAAILPAALHSSAAY